MFKEQQNERKILIEKMEQLREYWDVKKPVYLKRQPNFNGITITPIHNDEEIK